MTEEVRVIQADRDAAFHYMKLICDHRWSWQAILNGGCDNTSVVQAFARHRIANQPPAQDGLTAELESALCAPTWGLSLTHVHNALASLGDKPTAKEPEAMRYDFDGFGWQYIDSGSGSDWQTRHPDAEPLYSAE